MVEGSSWNEPVSQGEVKKTDSGISESWVGDRRVHKAQWCLREVKSEVLGQGVTSSFPNLGKEHTRAWNWGKGLTADLGAGRLVAGLPFCLFSMVSTSVWSIWRGKEKLTDCWGNTFAVPPQEQHTGSRDSFGTVPSVKPGLRGSAGEQSGVPPEPPLFRC